MNAYQDTPVTRPSHYGGEANPHEPIKVIEYYNLGFHIGNAVKYILRAGRKSVETEIDDLEKAVWYLSRHLQNLRKNTGDTA